MIRDCIYFKEHEDGSELEKYNECTRECSLFLKGKEDEEMCCCCRLWDSYIPKDSTPEQIEKAQKWQNMGYDEQPDYDEYFDS
jgi:hypothetical protein